MSEDTARPPYVAYELFLIASELGRHVASCQNQLKISTGHKLCLCCLSWHSFNILTLIS